MPWIECTRSIMGHQVRRYIPDQLSTFQSDFRETVIINNSLFWDRIAEIINVPYEDLSLQNVMCHYEDSDSKIHVYRSNHDVAHGIRKLLYIIKLFTLLRDNDDRCKEYLDSMSTQETNLLYLLVFLERAGRTNEYGSSYDKTILERTTQIFSAVAINQLAVTPAMAKNFCEILQGNCHERTTSMFTSLEQQFIMKRTSFLHVCVVTAHHIDLLRCRQTRDVREWLFQDIKALLPFTPKQQIKDMTNQIISFAETLLVETGTNYNAMNGAIYPDNRQKKAACVSTPGVRLQELHGFISAPTPSLNVLDAQAIPMMDDPEVTFLAQP